MGGKPPLSPLAPASFPDLPEIGGVSFATVAAGVRYQGRTDVMLCRLAPGTSMAGVFTRSSTRSAAVLDCQDKIAGDSEAGAAILVNSGNANAFTGKHGRASVEAVTAAAAKVLDLPQERIFTSSTGVIGEPMKHDRIIAKLEELDGKLSAAGISEAAEAIMTTDTFPKGSTTTVEIDGKPVRIAGIAKGSGMIAPDMATMLVYIFTDAAVERSVLQDMVSALTDLTFNCITVDSDTSTSDTLLLAATGASGVSVTADSTAFIEGLRSVMLDLAHQVVKDGEGASKFIEIHVTGAQSDADAKTHALAIANSPLIKTAVAGEDPNWGRIVMAIGKSGAAADRDLISIWFGDTLVAEKGWVAETYREEDGANHMKGQDIVFKVDLGLGGGTATVWTCDLTHGYIAINADYRS
ncbi:bifunctional glutamate N-acetyltransferase/amino-acid acetyltransferase ArgJ [Pseudooceanicola sp. 502str34]|uniref:bifunctional glutamate N-acetyltransferase/amino-acid acetyltransferase ArgJ n=1 Tax=Maritimibacter alkaliphilus TaxID=404236 RepID=UPI001C98378B|nr:bifunctional glutamate N-acetyltransferase/amino-acid acetyltransferase ArgJ [Maritimibacter alkaliphilus]MBY6090568.1 bifunctional glutamate N-acetyltransferase/amino-acid acetyltransferase ArgJ [Maritimibacter alkaliphilus]